MFGSILNPLHSNTTDYYPVWKSKPEVRDYIKWTDGLNDQQIYDANIKKLANALLLDDPDPQVEMQEFTIYQSRDTLKFPDGSLIAGSFIMNLAANIFNSKDIAYDDIDIYFKSKAHATEFFELNGLTDKTNLSDICTYDCINGIKFNFIYGIKFDSPRDLLGKFDIRACAIAVDPNASKMYCVQGTLQDIMARKINFNPVPRGVSVRRLVKYVEKGFSIDRYQRLFFVELLKTDIYSPELEILTKEY